MTMRAGPGGVGIAAPQVGRFERIVNSGDQRFVFRQVGFGRGGFGGVFSVRIPEVSNAMTTEKLRQARATEAMTIITADPGCLMHLTGRAARTGALPVVHLASALRHGIGGPRG